MPTLQQGCVILAETLDPQGQNPKVRPLVVISQSADIAAGATLVCVAITRQIPSNQLPIHVLLPYSNSGKANTGLKERCAAHCEWLATVDQKDVKRIIGIVPTRCLQDINAIIASKLSGG